mmetsp:Transcript_37979/g.121891  ORF Transcript_37979/g.121891 Transcript_37979/m.121891 type:complete len:248 (+) Transcript_37979:1606-2349(+)
MDGLEGVEADLVLVVGALREVFGFRRRRVLLPGGGDSAVSCGSRDIVEELRLVRRDAGGVEDIQYFVWYAVSAGEFPVFRVDGCHGEGHGEARDREVFGKGLYRHGRKIARKSRLVRMQHPRTRRRTRLAARRLLGASVTVVQRLLHVARRKAKVSRSVVARGVVVVAAPWPKLQTRALALDRQLRRRRQGGSSSGGGLRRVMHMELPFSRTGRTRRSPSAASFGGEVLPGGFDGSGGVEPGDVVEL